MTIRDKLCEEEIFCDNYRDDHANTWQVKDPICVELDVIHDSGVVTISRTFLGEYSIILRLEVVISLKLSFSSLK